MKHFYFTIFRYLGHTLFKKYAVWARHFFSYFGHFGEPCTKDVNVVHLKAISLVNVDHAFDPGIFTIEDFYRLRMDDKSNFYVLQ